MAVSTVGRKLQPPLSANLKQRRLLTKLTGQVGAKFFGHRGIGEDNLRRVGLLKGKMNRAHG